MNKMTIESFEQLVKERSVNQTDFFKMTALTGELGELANVIKKAEFYDMFEGYKQRVDKEVEEGTRKSFLEQFVDEAGDTFYYFIQLLQHWNINLEEVMEYQRCKLEFQDEIIGKKFKK